MPRLYVSKGFSLTQHDQSFLEKLKESVLVKPVQKLPVTDSKTVPWNYNKIVVFYRGKEIVEEVDEARGLTRSGRCYSLEELGKGKMVQDIQVPLKKAVTDDEAEEFLKNTKALDYSVVEQLKKTLAQISLLSLLLHLEEHRRVLTKILNEAHASKETMVNHLEKMANRIFESNTITFTDDEFPTEGAGHNRALYLTVKCKGHYVKRVMIDGGSGLDICPLSTLQAMDRHGSGSPINSASVDRFKERDPIVQPYLSSSSSMVATTMLKYGYQPGKGLGLCSQGIVDPIILLGDQGTFGLGYKQSKRNGDKAKNYKRTDWALPQRIPHFSHSFIKPQGPEMEASFTNEDIEEVIQNLL
ncbi:hypothetical protein KY290_000727 [Solanum tuberosum]|uniref:G-patch domain-containing protein n=1 Tax=Solanum tuberosum TaxID=4113 RepID=A0ABQ7WK44_SOLTU|nr:hypothetical protein KY289_000784 [Solanum tuberosum]KAH0781129.1 hypothetical protein KY290_000727 [Solanum tuberosum]